MAYKQPSSGPFKMMGSSPAKAKLPTDPNKNKPKPDPDPDYNVPQRDLDGEKIAKKKKESTAMSDKIKETSIANYSKTNKALVKAGKPTMTRAEYNESLGRSKESSI
jgi:hypothetical protein